jgi:hypothetical protein
MIGAKKPRQYSPLFNASDEIVRSLSPPVDLVPSDFNEDFYSVGNDNGPSAEELLIRATMVATPVTFLLEENKDVDGKLVADVHTEKIVGTEDYWEVLEEDEEA